MLDKNAIGYWKYGSLIVLVVFGLTVLAIILAIVNLKPDSAFFINYLQSLITLKSWGSITSIIGVIAAYLYLLFYMEQHQAFIPKEKTKEAKITIELFMLFRIINYIVPLLVLYLILVPKAYLYAGIVAGAFFMTTFAFTPISTYFEYIRSNYRTLEVLEPANIIDSIKKSMVQNKSDFKNLRSKVKNRDKNQSFLKILLLPYKGYIPAFIYGTLWTIIKKGGVQVKNSIILLTFLTIFIMLPTGINSVNALVIIYIELTLFYWFWISSIVFSGLPEVKIDVKLKDGTFYESVYHIQDNQDGYLSYLNAQNEVLNVPKSNIEKEIPTFRRVVSDVIKNLKELMSDKFTYLPIYCIENFNLSIETIKKDLDNPKRVTWHSEDVLKTVLKMDINRMPKKEEVSRIIDQFVIDFNNITIALYKSYIVTYKKLGDLTENDSTLMLGLYNTLLGYDIIYWPNIYNKIQESADLSKKYDSLIGQLTDIPELQEYKKLVDEALKMKNNYKNQLEKIAS